MKALPIVLALVSSSGLGCSSQDVMVQTGSGSPASTSTGSGGGSVTSAASTTVGGSSGPTTGSGGAGQGGEGTGSGGTPGTGGAALDADVPDNVVMPDSGGPDAPVGPTLGGGNPNSMGLDRHDALYCGEWQKTTSPGDTIYLIKGGKVAWTHSLNTAGKDEFGDCTMLSNGHVVYDLKATGAQEIAPDLQAGKEGPIVWRYDEDPGTEVHSVQPIGLDKVLVMQNGTPAKLMLINKTVSATCKSNMPCVEKLWHPESVGGVHGMFRHVRMIANGNLLVPYLSQGKVVEYTQDWQIVWQYDQAPSVWAAVRLRNGNTLISGNGGGWWREITPDKQIAWQFAKADSPFPIYTAQGAMRLANGNTILNNWCGSAASTADWPSSVQVFEVTPDKKVVWKVQQWSNPNLGPGSSTQALDEPGIPEKPGDLLR